MVLGCGVVLSDCKILNKIKILSTIILLLLRSLLALNEIVTIWKTIIYVVVFWIVNTFSTHFNSLLASEPASRTCVIYTVYIYTVYI